MAIRFALLTLALVGLAAAVEVKVGETCTNANTGTLAGPHFLAASPSDGSILISELTGHVVKKMVNGEVTVMVGSGTAGAMDGIGTEATFKDPAGIAISIDGKMAFVCDTGNNYIRRISLDGAVVKKIAGGEAVGKTDGVGTVAQFNGPKGIVVATTEIAYVADNMNHMIRKLAGIDGEVATVSLLAGSGSIGSADGTGNAASFYRPHGLAVMADGHILVADMGNNKIRKITPAGVVTTLAGEGTSGYLDSTVPTDAKFASPFDISITTDDAFALVTEEGGNRVRKIDLASGEVTTLAGSTDGEMGTADGLTYLARFNTPRGLVVVNKDKVLVADFGSASVCLPPLSCVLCNNSTHCISLEWPAGAYALR
ncbi:hypothetical protein T484DRAFT_2541846 [Baffinella frigidus]|nr:hypothetical protein T484DRAFT_2541846 [Cryptophyta sp. CCMP2293]